MPSSAARSSLATTSAAAPSFSPLEFPAVTVPSFRNAGFSAASFPASVSGRGCSSRVEHRRRGRARRRTARGVRRRPASLRLQRERVLVLARDAPALGDVLAGLAHRLEREQLLHPRVREAPAERGVPDGLVAAGERLLRLRHHEGRAAHRLDPARDEQVAVAGDHRVRSPDHRRQPRRTEPVDGHARDRVRQARRAAPPCARRSGCPRRPGWRSRARRPRSRRRGRRHARPPPRSRSRRGRPGRTSASAAAVAADRRADGGEDHCAWHRSAG